MPLRRKQYVLRFKRDGKRIRSEKGRTDARTAAEKLNVSTSNLESSKEVYREYLLIAD